MGPFVKSVRDAIAVYGNSDRLAFFLHRDNGRWRKKMTETWLESHRTIMGPEWRSWVDLCTAIKYGFTPLAKMRRQMSV